MTYVSNVIIYFVEIAESIGAAFLIHRAIKWDDFPFDPLEFQAPRLTIEPESNSKSTPVFKYLLVFAVLAIFAQVQSIVIISKNIQLYYILVFLKGLIVWSLVFHLLFKLFRKQFTVNMIKSSDYVYFTFAIVTVILSLMSGSSSHGALLKGLSAIFASIGIALRLSRTTAEIKKWHVI